MREIIQELKRLNAKRIFVQYPEGLKMKIQEIAKELEKEGFEIILCLEATWGACDIRDAEAKRFDADLILHIGHTDYGVKSELPVVYWEYFHDLNPIPTLKKNIDKLKDFKRIGLISSVQYVKSLDKVKKFLEKRGKEVHFEKSKTEKYPGQILGCRVNAGKFVEDKIDCFLYVGTGKFHGLGLDMKTTKPLFCLDLEKQDIYSLEQIEKKIQRIIAWNKVQFKEAKRVGVLATWKKGQQFGPAFNIKKKLEEQGKEVYILAMDEITPEKLIGLKLDFLVNLACPRIGMDDLMRYKIPMLNFNMLA